MKLIINADDLGSSKIINDEAFYLMSLSKISSATIMANGPFFRDAVKKVDLYNNCSFGCHLNLTQFESLSKSQIMEDNGLVDDFGFTGKLRQIKWNRAFADAIYFELEQQITRLLDNGVKLSHLDSHHHIHSIPSIFFILKKLQKRFNIRKIRNTMNFYGEYYNPPLQIKINKFLWTNLVKYYFRSVLTDYFTSFILFKKQNTKLADSTIELMCHPGNPLYAEETVLLHSNYIRSKDLQLISYNNL